MGSGMMSNIKNAWAGEVSLIEVCFGKSFFLSGWRNEPTFIEPFIIWSRAKAQGICRRTITVQARVLVPGQSP